jgi:hypothetical protein
MNNEFTITLFLHQCLHTLQTLKKNMNIPMVEVNRFVPRTTVNLQTLLADFVTSFRIVTSASIDTKAFPMTRVSMSDVTGVVSVPVPSIMTCSTPGYLTYIVPVN